MRTLIWMATACTFGFVAAMTLIHLGHLNGGLVIAAVAAGLITAEGILYCSRRRERMRRGREAVWRRRILEEAAWERHDLDAIQREWHARQDAFKQPGHIEITMCAPVWPHEAGAPE